MIIMNFRMSKISLSLLVLATTTKAYYIDRTAPHYVPVTVPQQKTSFHYGVEGFFARPTNGDLYFAIFGNDLMQDFALAARTYRAVIPVYTYGVRVDAGIKLGDSGTDFSANWTHFTSEDTEKVTRTTTTPALAPFLYNRFSQGKWDSTEATVPLYFDEINIELGQLVSYCNLYSRFFFGFSGARIDDEFSTTSTRVYNVSNGNVVSFFGNTQTGVTTLKSEFWGFGPRLGFDINYPIGGPGGHFSFIGHAAGSILGGRVDAQQRDTRTVLCSTPPAAGSTCTAGDNITVFNRILNSDNLYTVVPAGTVKLGLRFSLNPNPAGNGFSVEAGYRATGYYNVVQISPHFSNSVQVYTPGVAGTPPTLPTFIGSGDIEPLFESNTSNFGFSGFYLTLNYS